MSTGRVAKYANHVSALMRNVVFDPAKATRSDVERVVAWINSQPCKSSTKGDMRLTPESLLTLDDLNAMLGSAENERDRALVTILFETALRPGELLNMKVRSVEFMASNLAIIPTRFFSY